MINYLSIFDIFKEVNMGKGILETLYMVFFSTIFAYILGLPLGVFTVLTDSDGILKNRILHKILSTLTNIGRSIPFIILIVTLLPITRFIVGKSWGPTATIVPLSIAATFFVSRIVEQSLKETDHGVIESAICMGANLPTLIFKVYIGEALPSLIRGVALTVINLIGYSAMAGAVGGGGLGDIAIRYGYYKYRIDVTLVTLVVIIIIVEVTQLLFDFIAKQIDKK